MKDYFFERVKRHIKIFIYKLMNIDIAINSNIVLYGVPKIYHKYNVKFGLNVRINEDVFINAVGGVYFGNNVTLSHGVSIISTTLDTIDWLQNNGEKIISRKHKSEQIILGNNVWVGANSTILSGTSIASNIIIAAGSIVCSSLLEENCIYGGVPAKKIKTISKE
ncbi:MAG: acyltransferase [Pleomorphochaeta sp.]